MILFCLIDNLVGFSLNVLIEDRGRGFHRQLDNTSEIVQTLKGSSRGIELEKGDMGLGFWKET